jgi:glycosyltransferase involved in cell wall biosynthesis
MARLAWFTPLPPAKSGISRYNWELLPALAAAHQIDVFVDGSPGAFRTPDKRIAVLGAHDFIWKHHREPYDLVVYQLGNAPYHDYMWSYLTRYPGLVILHDGQLHHARGRMLLQRWKPRQDDYRREFWFNHPDANRDVGELGINGLLGSLTYLWPMLRLVVESSRCIIVHNGWLAEQIREVHAHTPVEVVAMGVPEAEPRPGARARVRARHALPADAVVFTAFGKATPEKRLREAIRALAFVCGALPQAHLLVAGETVDYYDLRAEAGAHGVSDKVTLAGYVDDEDVDDYLAASDVCLCTRWPTSRETSASWLRCIAAGVPTITTDLAHTADIPALDPQSWMPRLSAAHTKPVTVSIDILDEDHSLRLAMKRLASDPQLRATMGASARSLWAARFRLETMAAGYQDAIARALRTPSRTAPALPPHFRHSGVEHAHALVSEVAGSTRMALDLWTDSV